jgi:putative redox protein
MQEKVTDKPAGGTPWRAEVRQFRGTTFLGRAKSNHWVVMDSGVASGGSAAGASPKELLLLALAGCTGHDIVGILDKCRTPLAGLEIQVRADERDEHPRIFTAIHLEYIFSGNGLRDTDVERAVELSRTRYCSIAAMLGATVPITTSWRIESGGGAGSSRPGEPSTSSG